MKALKKAVFVTFMMSTLMLIAIGGYNSSIVDKSALFRNDFGVKFARRLDEIKGEITVGRMAASIPKWKKTSTELIKKQTKQLINKKRKVVSKKKAPKKNVIAKPSTLPAPVINDDLELSLSGGFYNKKALADKAQFSGSAVVQDGVIEEISVSLPGGQSFSINTNERMVGNVFQYEDTGTRERKSGLFYKVKEGVYMLTLTDDTQYPGLRLEFRTNGNTQNLAAEENNLNAGPELEQQQDESSEYVENQEVESDYYQDAAVEESGADQSSSNNSTTYGFNFNS